jgi:D-alanyl-D-alanine carboxypeptidase (penicillin-binding protein 5/6)
MPFSFLPNFYVTRGRCGLLTALFLALAALLPHAGPAQAQGFQTAATHAILVDADSGAVLFEKAPDDPFPPASMAKLMTAEIVFRELTAGRLTMDRELVVSENAWRKGGGRADGSSMFAPLNSSVKIGDLLRGLIVQSGNDAAIALAEGIAGSEDNFARLMNERAKEIGLTRSTFRNPTGYGHPEQRMSARDLAKLSLHIIETYPEYYKIYSEREFTWNKIRQQNRNPLLAEFQGADGLKTGYLEESGYALSGTAVQNGQRLIMVISGLKTMRDRASEARKLLDYGFRTFEGRQLFEKDVVVGEAQVFGGDRSAVPLVSNRPVRVLLPRGANEPIVARIAYTGPLKAPIKKGKEVARLKVMRGEAQALDMPLYAAEDVGVGTLTQRAVDGLMEFGSGWIRRAFSAVTDRG